MDRKHKQQNGEINLRYCHKNEVNKKWQKDIHEKSTFLSKIVLLKRIGKDNQLMRKTDHWLEDNIEMFTN